MRQFFCFFGCPWPAQHVGRGNTDVGINLLNCSWMWRMQAVLVPLIIVKIN